MARQKREVGAVVKIPLSDGTHSYGLILDKASIAVFEIKTLSDLELGDIIKGNILFIVAVHKSAITSGRWTKIGKTVLDNRFKILPLKFIQDSLNLDVLEIYNPNTGEIYRSTKEACVNLECAAVWEAEHIESRIEDHFNGRENVWIKQLQLK
jgi:hypothetical protein